MALREECGIFGIFGDPHAVSLTYYALHSLQHRGQEGGGIVCSDGKTLAVRKGEGLISEVFAKDGLGGLSGTSAIGHVRYSSREENGFENLQPLVFRSSKSAMAIAHNGELVNAIDIRNRLEEQGSIFQTTSDTEVLAHLIRRSYQPLFRDKVREALRSLVGGFAFVVLTPNELICAQDRNGLHPLSLGKMNGALLVASESCAFDVIGATYWRDVEPGEMIVVDADGVHSDRFDMPGVRRLCSMEYIYFARPDSDLDGVNVHAARKRLGKQLAIELPVEADIVIGVPDSSTSAAVGYAEQSGIPNEMGLIKNRYVGRTFIQPSRELREHGVKMKLSAVRGVVNGKRIVVIDDSIVRGTTMKRIISLLRNAGATEVHIRISSAPLIHPCHYGIDLHSYEELISSQMDVEELTRWLEADSLGFLSIEGMMQSFGRAVDLDTCGRCVSCFTGVYPTVVNEIPRPERKVIPQDALARHRK